MKIFLRIIVFLYLVFCGALFYIQDKVVFRPEKINETFHYGIGEEIEIPLEDELSMNALFVQEDAMKRSNKVILYLHGNRGSIRFGTYQIRQMRNSGYDILIPDYRGYGKTEGKPINDKQLLADAEKAYLYLTKHYKEDDIVIIGYSLGSGMASYVASKHNPKHVLLIAPFTSLIDIKNQFLWFAPDFLLKYKLNTEKHLSGTNCPVSILHGTKDKVVPYQHALNLLNKYPDKIKLFTSENTGHRRIIFDQLINQILKKI